MLTPFHIMKKNLKFMEKNLKLGNPLLIKEQVMPLLLLQIKKVRFKLFFFGNEN